VEHRESYFKLGGWVSTQRSNRNSLPLNRTKKLEALGFIWDANAEAWEEGFCKLEQFKEKEGDCRVPQKHKEDGYNLGNWISSLRQYKDRLSSEQIKRLDALGFVWDPHKEAWEEGYSKLLKFYKREGNCLVRRGHKEDHYKLDIWVLKQRRKKDKLSAEQISRLDALDFVWDPITTQWEEGFSKLLRFYKREGNCLVRRGHKEDDYKLDIWVFSQRRKKDKLSAEQISRLNALDFVWDPITAQWEEGFSKLLKFYHREDNCKVLAKHQEDGFKLGQWVQVQRRNKDKLSSARIGRLDALGFIWGALSEKWEEGFSKLLKFYEREGNSTVPRGHNEDGYKLANWVQNLRHKKFRLSPVQIGRLDALGFVWEPYKEAWEKGYSKLLKFYKREGNCLVKSKHKEDDFKLGIWVGTQRSNKDSLSLDQIKRLDALGFIWKAR
jgi:hypothetical protein